MAVAKWLDWVRRLQSIAQAGFTYNTIDFDQERYQQIQAVASEMAEAHTDIPKNKIDTLYQHEKGYATPKVDVRGIVFNENEEILLVKEASTGKWTLPGGWADVWDTPSQAVEREIREESGYETKATKLLALFDRDNQGHPAHEFSIWKSFFLCELQGGEARTSTETSDVGFFAEDNLPELDTGRTLEKHNLRFFEHYRDSSLATDFD